MSADQFKKVFAKIVKDTPPVDFNNTVDVIINNDKLRPTDPADLTAYQNFLVSNLSTTADSNRILSIIDNAFFSISDPAGMIVAAFSNHNCNIELLSKISAKFLDKLNSEKNIAETLFALCENENISDLLSLTLRDLKNHSAEAVISEMGELVHKDTAPDVLLAVTGISADNLDLYSAHTLLVKCLKMSFEQVNQVDVSIRIIGALNDNKADLKDIKNVLSDCLRSGFVSTSSDDLKMHILGLVASFGIKSQFKKTLKGEDLAYYQKWMK